MSPVNNFAYRPVRWPMVVGALAIIAGLAMLIAAGWGFKYAGRIAMAQPVQVGPAANPSMRYAVESAAIVAPPAAMHLADMRALFKLAGEKRLALGPIEYQTESNRAAGVLVKRVVMSVDDEYPKLKWFVAELLRAMPHAQLEDIRIEQATGSQPASKVQASIRVSFVYRVDEAEFALKRVATGS